jgi:hypothetical protein
MKIFNSVFVLFFGIALLFVFSCKKKNDLVISLDTDTIFVNQAVRFSVNVDFKVKEEEWKVLETNTILSNVSAGTYKFTAKGIYTLKYSAKMRLGKLVTTQRKLVVYALPGIIKNYWGNNTVAHADISLWVKGTRYDGKYYEDSIFYEKEYGMNSSSSECEDIYEPKVFLNVPGGRYKCFLKYKYFQLGTVWVEHSDSVFIDNNCEAFNY